ncbi:transposase domain-containing protein [Streptomyces sp. NPDC088353]|uniref:transposase domain-containing protein n=1 Tax=Streptomyces sp. NPDC088353 TaxID=3365855 RepID=UPI003823C4CE
MDDGDPPRSSLPTDGIPLRLQSAITTITRSLTVASGLFAPGHLGELTPHVPFELVDSVLQETGRVQRRLRALPSRSGVYYVFALVLFPELSYAAVWRQLTASLGPMKPPRSLGDSPAAPAPSPVPGPVQGPVPDTGRPPRPAGHTRRVLPALAHGRLRRLLLDQDTRQRPRPNLAGEGPLPPGLGRLPHHHADDAHGDRHPRPARKPASAPPPRARPPTPPVCCPCWTSGTWCSSTAASTPMPSSPTWPRPAPSSW